MFLRDIPNEDNKRIGQNSFDNSYHNNGDSLCSVVVHLRIPTARPKFIVWEKACRDRIKCLEQQVLFVRLTPTWGGKV